ncbi:hypothetical protein N7530_010192 [Penicillium desertorum]|uniref:Uncharacterized protein n=1 Tax=Penicillium desertorum TaxID=1303715 RepID=A0A9X0BIT1_9EURO|nr:hypothetical protein N7530_010192 [Penicillium desertorum]
MSLQRRRNTASATSIVRPRPTDSDMQIVESSCPPDGTSCITVLVGTVIHSLSREVSKRTSQRLCSTLCCGDGSTIVRASREAGQTHFPISENYGVKREAYIRGSQTRGNVSVDTLTHGSMSMVIMTGNKKASMSQSGHPPPVLQRPPPSP